MCPGSHPSSARRRSRELLTWLAQHRVVTWPSKNRKIVNDSVTCGAVICPCALTQSTRSLARVSELCSMGSSTTFARLALWLTIFAVADRPLAFSGGTGATYAGGGFNFCEGLPRHHPRDPTPTSLRLGESLWGTGMPNPLCRIRSSTVVPFESCKRSRPSVSSHRVTATSSEGTQRLSTRVLQDMLRRRKNPRSLTSCCRPRRAWATACSSTP